MWHEYVNSVWFTASKVVNWGSLLDGSMGLCVWVGWKEAMPLTNDGPCSIVMLLLLS